MQKLLREIRKAVKRGTFTLKGGETSSYYLDLRMLYGDPKLVKLIGRELAKKIPKNITGVAASGYGGITLGTIVSQITNLPLILVRNEKKDHGLTDSIIGYKPSAKDRIVIVDDICTSGTSILETKRILSRSGVKKMSALVIVKRGKPKQNIFLKSLFSIKEILSDS